MAPSPSQQIGDLPITETYFLSLDHICPELIIENVYFCCINHSLVLRIRDSYNTHLDTALTMPARPS